LASALFYPHFVNASLKTLKCGLLEHGFLRVKCEACSHEYLVAFSCKRRGFCPSCGARRMIESAAHLVDHVLPGQPIRQWVLSFPYPLRFLSTAKPQVLTQVLGVVVRAISTCLIEKAGFTVCSGAMTGAVTLIQRFGSALNLSIHFHMLFLDGVYAFDRAQPTYFGQGTWSARPNCHLLKAEAIRANLCVVVDNYSIRVRKKKAAANFGIEGNVCPIHYRPEAMLKSPVLTDQLF
jgi:ribosomal protein S27E